MRHLPHFVLVALAIQAGCSGEPEKKPTATKPLLELRMQPPARTITVDTMGAISDVISPNRASGKLAPDDLKALQGLAASIDWAKLPLEGFKTADGKPVEGGRSYTLVYSGTTPPRTVQSMDGAAEVASFTKLRDTIELYANKIGR
jgi:hypothetical protein